MISRALILPAGRGAMLGSHAGPNCLATVGRTTLIERTLRLLSSVGVQDIAIVVGWQGQAIRDHIARSTQIGPAQKRAITFFENADWEQPNGLSAQVARPFVTERTLLLMADQITAP